MHTVVYNIIMSTKPKLVGGLTAPISYAGEDPITAEILKGEIEQKWYIYNMYAVKWCNKMNYAMANGNWDLLSDLSKRVGAVSVLVAAAKEFIEELKTNGDNMTTGELVKLSRKATQLFNGCTKKIMKHWKENEDEAIIEQTIEYDRADTNFSEEQKQIRAKIQNDLTALNLGSLGDALPL